MKTKYLHKNRNLLFFIFLLLGFVTGCSRVGSPNEVVELEEIIASQSTQVAHLSTEVARQQSANQSQWDAISYISTQMPYALELITPIPPGITITPTHTPFASIDIEYPPNARTGIAEIDRVIDAILSQDVGARLELVRYSRSACTTADGLGGPPKCKQSEADGTMVDAFPVSSGEGIQVRPEEIQNGFDFTVRGLFAVYEVPDDAHHADYWPAGEYGVVFTSEDGGFSHIVTVLVEDGQIVRLVFGFGWPPFEMVWGKSDTFILPPIR
ncbi:MAG: hypothetical protein ACXADB_11495 [Candidatus Hermodarchaeia archaeon]